MTRRFVCSLLLASAFSLVGCGGDDGGAQDAGLDAIRRLAITVEGPGNLAAARSVTVTLSVTNTTRMESFPIAGLPTTVDMDAPIQLSDWMIRVDGFDMTGQLIGRGMTTVASGTAQATVTLAPI